MALVDIQLGLRLALFGLAIARIEIDRRVAVIVCDLLILLLALLFDPTIFRTLLVGLQLRDVVSCLGDPLALEALVLVQGVGGP